MKVLFIYAHIDDETINSYGFIQKLLKSNASIEISIMCGQSNEKTQQKTLFDLFKNQNIKINLGPYTNISVTQHDAKMFVNSHFLNQYYDIVVTHSTTDLHYEHRLLAEEVLVALRFKSLVAKCLLFSSSCINLWSYNQFGTFQPNYFIDISNYIDDKKYALKKYENIGLIPINKNDLRSLTTIINNNMLYGANIGVNAAEVYQQIFQIN